MITKHTIKADGTLISEVIDRQHHMCGEIYRVTERLGTMVSDEELPDCSPTQHEVSGEGGSGS
jgi:hypothetical protein